MLRFPATDRTPVTLCEDIHKQEPVKQERATSQIGQAMNQGWVEGGSFLGSILAGTLLGYLADHWLGTEPWLVVVGILLGAYSGFARMWAYSKRMEEDPRER